MDPVGPPPAPVDPSLAFRALEDRPAGP
ncbi:MAG: hypothetical protein RLZZ624_574, partial [Cyanobacteriota bacterium]